MSVECNVPSLRATLEKADAMIAAFPKGLVFSSETYRPNDGHAVEKDLHLPDQQSVKESPAKPAFLDAMDATIKEEVMNEMKKEFAPLYAAAMDLRDFADPIPDEDDPNAIFKTGYLERGGLMILVSTLGVGKSTFVSQGSECWAVGRDFLGFTPARPLSIGVFQTEDSDKEIAKFRNNFRKGFADAGWDESEIRLAEGDNSPRYYPVRKVMTADFLDYLEYCQQRSHHDLVIINPAYDFIEGALSKQEDVARWKVRLNTLMEEYRFATLLVNHTNKVPSNAKDRDGWNTGLGAAYAGTESMELPSAARAVVFIRPTEKVKGVFELIAAKRGGELGWKDADGNPTTSRYIAHSDKYIFWRDATPEEVEMFREYDCV